MLGQTRSNSNIRKGTAVTEASHPRFGSERRERILAELRSTGSVRVRDLATTFEVNELTIRRDINALADQGLLTRVHGGAVARSPLDVAASDRSNSSSSAAPRYTLGIVVPSLDYYWPQVVSGARAAAVVGRSRLLVRGSSYDMRDYVAQIRALAGTPGLNGLIVTPDWKQEGSAELIDWLDTLPVPVVLAERRVPDWAEPNRLQSVSTDHEHGVKLAIRHLREAGHERIALLTSPQSPTSTQIQRGWERSISESDPSAHVTFHTDAAGLDVRDREAILDRVLADCRATSSTALIIHSDPQALVFLQHCSDRGVSVPGDLSVIAYDDEVAHLGHPALTAVRPPKQQLGRLAVELLLARLDEGPRRPPQRTQLLPDLIVRDSSGPTAVPAVPSVPRAHT